MTGLQRTGNREQRTGNRKQASLVEGQGSRVKASILFAVRCSLFALFALSACRGTMSPLSNRLNVGEESFTVVVAEGEGGVGDLYALPPGGGVPLQITFSRVDESHPALTSDGSVIAFIRAGQKASTQPIVVLMNLLNGAERKIELPAGAVPERISWSPDQTRIFVRSAKGVFVIEIGRASCRERVLRLV